MLYLKKIALTIIIVCGFVVINKGLVRAEIQITVDRHFSINSNGQMQVDESEQLYNNFSDRYIPGGTTRRYFFVISAQDQSQREKVANQIYSSVNLNIDGQSIAFTKINEDIQYQGGSVKDYGISYQLLGRLSPHTKQTIALNYLHPELGEKVGGLLDAYIPAFATDFQFNSDTTSFRYNTTLKIPHNSGAENIISITPLSKYILGDNDVYIFDQESLRGKFVWVQRGSQQVYKFDINQKLLASQSTSTGNVNEYQLIIPRDITEVNISQKVYFTNLNPQPLAINLDTEGNMIAVYRFKADQEATVLLSGYAVLTAHKQDLTRAGNIADILNQHADFARYLQPAEYWQVNNPEILAAANKYSSGTNDIYQVLTQEYTNVVNTIDYSQVKRFGLNERQGALETLHKGAGVCMEYSDLYLTLMRTKGIPTRAAFGYGYDSRLASDAQEPHQWVQVYLPSYKNWIGVDVTWGESGPKVIGGDLNHFYTHLAAVDPNTPPVLSRIALGASSFSLNGPKYQIQVLAEPPSNNGLSATDLLAKYPPLNHADLNYYLNAVTTKLTYSLSNIFHPTNIDAQGWLLIGLAFSGIMLFLLSLNKFIRIIKDVFRKIQSRKLINKA